MSVSLERIVPLARVAAGLVLLSLLSPLAGAQRASRGARSPAPEPAAAPREPAVSSASLCVGALRDQAGGACLQASSVRTLGRLWPLGPELWVDPSGRVGVGTLAPAEALDVQGTVRARAGGFRFPDGSLQPSAALPADPRPTAPLGTVTISGLPCGATPIWSMSHTVTRPVGVGSPAFTLSFTKDVDGCSFAVVTSAFNGTNVGDVAIVVGSDTFTARQATLLSVDMVGDARGLPRERVTVSFTRIDWDHAGGTSSGTWSSTTSSGSASPSFAGKTLTLVVPDADPVPSGGQAARSTRLDWTGAPTDELVVVRPVDVATPSIFVACAAAHAIPTLEATVMRYDATAGKDAEYLKHTLSAAQVTSVRVDVDPLEGWRETLTAAGGSLRWDFLVNGVPTSAP